MLLSALLLAVFPAAGAVAGALVVAPRDLPVGQAFTRSLLRRSILATPAEGAKMLVRPSSQRTRKRGGSWDEDEAARLVAYLAPPPPPKQRFLQDLRALVRR